MRTLGEGLARRLLLETEDAIDAVLSDFNKIVAQRSNMTHQSPGHQDPPPGGGGNGHQPNDTSQNSRQPGNLKDPDAHADNSHSNVSTNSGAANSSGTVISAAVTEDVTNGTNQPELAENISRVLSTGYMFHESGGNTGSPDYPGTLRGTQAYVP